MKNKISTLACCLTALLIAGCGDGDDLDSDAEARWAYLGFDTAIDKAINLGFDGYNAATNANIPEQNATGAVAGTMDITGQVDQGASNNKEMRLDLTLTDYDDGVFDDPTTEDTEELGVAYTTDPAALPRLTLSLKNVPNGDLTGSLIGKFAVTGSVEADADFNLILSAEIQEDPQNAGDVIRKPGTLSITGTVTSGDGTYDVNVMR
jgi:hypothetical protein